MFKKQEAIDLLKKYDAIEEGTEAGLDPLQVALDEFITCDPDLIKVKHEVHKLSPTDIPILILGETGTGKELIAQALHGRRKKNFVPVNCAGIPDTLLESEFFGVSRGAYTGADRDRSGLIEEAAGGTLFLDEIGDMPMLLQAKLLRALQSKRYRRVGETTERLMTCRIVSATNLTKEEILKGKGIFRADLFYRLAAHILYLKPLRERPQDDIIQITEKYAKSLDIAVEINSSTYMRGNQWPGNVRQLINHVLVQNILAKPEPYNNSIPLKPIASVLTSNPQI